MGTVAQWGHFAGEFLKFVREKKRERPSRKTQAIVQLIVIILQHFAQV